MDKRSIAPKYAIAYFKKQGEDITEEDAIEILDFMYFLSKNIVKRLKVGLSKKGRARRSLKKVIFSHKKSH
ncbi:hypothetical protein QWY86_03175 [Pedobacter aquatilis]|uniref:hypothetical protein n=1 Tax=Pedobacter aquatilis TaxID=351343 RepID=UPI0025B2BE01|nr:hypothetical protein [Pedobacter aquatilis]MDN3585653.1 hypothetical protein [Pedobacter aquatilis]